MFPQVYAIRSDFHLYLRYSEVDAADAKERMAVNTGSKDLEFSLEELCFT